MRALNRLGRTRAPTGGAAPRQEVIRKRENPPAKPFYRYRREVATGGSVMSQIFMMFWAGVDAGLILAGAIMLLLT